MFRDFQLASNVNCPLCAGVVRTGTILCQSCHGGFTECNTCANSVETMSLNVTKDRSGDLNCGQCVTQCQGCSEFVMDTYRVGDEAFCNSCKNNYCECADCTEVISLGDTEDVGRELFCVECYSVCSDCETAHRDDNHIDSENYCNSCYENYVFCNGCNDQIHTNDITTVSGSRYCADCLSDRCIMCSDCNEYVLENNSFQTCDESQICRTCRDNAYTECVHCNQYTDGSIEVDGELLCDGCFDRMQCGGIHSILGDTYTRTKAKLTFGMEIEFSECDGYRNWVKDTGWANCSDGSVPHGREFNSPILRGDEGLESIKKFCELAKGKQDTSCGVHLHVGVKDFSSEQHKSIGIAYHFTRKIWFAMVNKNRDGNHFCGEHKHTEKDLGNRAPRAQQIHENGGKFKWINYLPLSSKGTFELRLHHGSSDATRLERWVISHINFIDNATKLTPQESIDTFSGISDISKYIGMKQELLLLRAVPVS